MRKTQTTYHTRTNYNGKRELVLYNILDNRLCGYKVTVHEITGNRARLSVESSRGVKKHTLRLYHTNGGECVKLPLNTGEKKRLYIDAEELEKRP